MGDVVIVEAPVGRATWPLGKILEIVRDSNGIARSAVVLTRGLPRALTLNKLVSLEVDILEGEMGSLSPPTDQVSSGSDSQPSPPSGNTPENTVVDESADRDEPCTVVTRPRRRAAISARKNIRNQALSERMK